MSCVILGGGGVGFQLARQLVQEDKDVVLIERDPEKARQAATLLDCLVINEPGNKLETLRKAQIDKAQYFIAVTESDEVNMIACGMVSGESQAPYKIARIRNLDYSDTQVVQEPFLGIDHIVNPEIEASRAIIRAIERGAVSDVVFFENSRLQMRSLTVASDSVFRRRSIEQVKRIVRDPFLVAAILRDRHYLIPGGDTVIRENDKLYLIATEEHFDRIFQQLGKRRMVANKIVIVGGSTVGRHVAEHFLSWRRPGLALFRRLLRMGQNGRHRVHIIDSDYESCKRLAETYPEAMVINANISDEGFSDEEELADADVVVATSENQELNIVNAVYAKNLGAKRTIALVKKSSYVQIASTLGIDVAISPIDSMVNSILGLMRTGSVRSVHSLSGVEILELSVGADSQAAQKPLRSLKLPRDTLVLSVVREERDIVPDGELRLAEGDNVIVITRNDSVPRIEEVFAPHNG